jgi:hypothetical protein
MSKKINRKVKNLLDRLETNNIPERNLLIEQATAIGKFLKRRDLKRTLEVGLDYGVFACAIMDATQRRHLAMDPMQRGFFKNIGLENVASNGFGQAIEYYEGHSQLVLPYLWRLKRKFDFILINGDKKFDMCLANFILSDQVLETDGYIYLNCTWMPAVKKVENEILIHKKNEYELQEPLHDTGSLFKKTKESR